MALRLEPSVPNFRADIQGSTSSILYWTSTALLMAIIPYSYSILEPTTQKLEAKARSIGGRTLDGNASAETNLKREETMHYLVDRWATINLGRTVLSGVAAIVATWAAVERLNVAKFRVTTGAHRMGR